MQLQCFNGEMVPLNQPVLPLSNRGFKFGDGVFETMKVEKGVLQLAAYHFERLFTSLQLLQISASFSAEGLTENILQLCKANDCTQRGRVRLAVFRADSGAASYAIEAVDLPEEKVLWNEQGWTLDLYPFARKSVDVFANLKSANYLPYVMADLYAKEKGLDEALMLNCHGLLCDASKANLFLVKDDEILTPALHQGCVNGVMRRYIVEELKKKGYVVKQEALSQEDLERAEEVFLTNALQGIKWVQRFRNVAYGSAQTKVLHDLLF